MDILVTTRAPSPYQVELFDALAATGRYRLQVIYEMRRGTGRQWDASLLKHEHRFLGETDLQDIVPDVEASGLVIFSGYRHPDVRKLIACREEARKPWVFWGERPGFKIPPAIGRHYRRMVFPQLFQSQAPVWGIGKWAVEGYRKELGRRAGGRTFCNVPYSSGLDRYLAINRANVQQPPTRILFSGSLIRRKGIDILVRAFADLYKDRNDLELHLLGDGQLRERLETETKPLAERVHFHGFKQWAELPTFYDQADILCAPSRYDGWGLIVPEGLAAGLMVVSTDRTGSALDLLSDGTGWIARAGSLSSLTQALAEAIATCGPARAARIERGRTIAHQMSIEAGVERVEAAIAASLGSVEHANNACPTVYPVSGS